MTSEGAKYISPNRWDSTAKAISDAIAHVASLQREQERLQAELTEKYRDCPPDKLNRAGRMQYDRAEAAEADLAAAREALRKYGQHAGTCEIMLMSRNAKCTCGLDAALHSVPPAKDSTQAATIATHERTPAQAVVPTRVVPSGADSGHRISIEVWEGEDYIVTYDGAPIGQVVTPRDGAVITRWLRTAIQELIYMTAVLQSVSKEEK